MKGSFGGTVRLLTGAGRSAIATIQIAGDLTALDRPQPLFRAANSKPIHQQCVDALCFGVWGHPSEEVVVCRTSHETLEVTCHGGTAAVTRVLEDVANRGFVIESSRRPPDEAVLMQARTQRTAEILLEQASGVREKFIDELSSQSREDAQGLIQQALSWMEFGRHLVESWNVVLCGRPNVGKSSLMNALAGFTRSIVSEQAGTTRDRVTLETAIDGWPVRITDTAGVRETEDPIEQEGVQQTLSAMEEADLVVVVWDGSEPLLAEDHQLLKRNARRRLIVFHKADLPRAADLSLSDEPVVEVSSVTGDGLENLLLAISAALVPRQPPFGQWIPVVEDHSQWLQSFAAR